jgi:pimeloyl-ACP methyl ester carboxylesterase
VNAVASDIRNLTLSAGRDVSARRGPITNLKTVLRALGDGRIFGEAYGDGPAAIVWLHGWGRSGRDFAPVATQLAAAGVTSLSLDLPGFGASPPPDHAGGARLYATAVAAALEPLGHPVVLVGHSFGGLVAVVVAAERPELVRSLVLTGTPLVKSARVARPAWHYRVLRALHARGLVGDRRMESARQRYGSADYRAAQGVMRDVLVATINESYVDEMARVIAPVLLVWGAADAEVPVSVAERSLQFFEVNTTLVVLDGVAHWVPTEAPGSLAPLVREALA